jgi:P4 family phage/plasmid primase-like protien
MSNSLKNFLTKHKIKKGDEFTHTSLGSPPKSFPGSYYIPLEEYSEFIDLYYEHVFVKKRQSFLTERHQPGHGPILIDIDLRFNGILEERIYTIELIQSFLDIYIEELTKLINIPEKNLIAFVMEKPTISIDKNLTKDGIHIIFPYVIVEPVVQYVARYNTITNKKCASLFKSINVKNTLDEIFDICVIETNNWLMYGANKPDSFRYETTHIFKYDKNLNFNKIDINTFKNKDLIRLMSIRNKKDAIQHITEEEKGPIMQIYDSISTKQKAPLKKRKRVLKAKNIIKNSTTDMEFEIVKEIVSILKPFRVDGYENWMRLGWCLHNIDYRLLETWDTISKKSTKYASGVCKQEWDMMNNDGLGMGSLCRWAKEDNIVEFNKIMKTNLHKVMLDSLNATHHDIAQVVYHMFKHQFVCASSKKSVWYHFKNHRWKELDDAVELKKKISKDVINEYLRLNAELSIKASKLDSSSYERELIDARIKQIMKIKTSLKTNSFKKSVIAECSELFHIHKFEELLDNKVHLIGFENGVYDLEEGIFRDGIPEDYISFSTKIDYVPFDEGSEEIQEVDTFTKQVLPIEDVRRYVLRLFSSFLSGKTGHEKFHTWTGCGGNGKSKIIELFRLAFGDYCTTLPITIITEKRSRAEACNPSLAKTKGKRFACLQEPEKDESINVGLMKEITGGDVIEARGLYKDPIEFKPQFKLVLTCNDLPEIKASDIGTWRRVRVVNFPSKFVENPSKNTEAFEFLIDEDLEEKLINWKEAFMFMLLEEHKIYRQQGIKEPYSVTKHTKEYQNESNQFVQFINENIIESEECNGQELKLDDIYFVFQEWYKEGKGKNAKIPTRKDLQKDLEKKFGKCSGVGRKAGWVGITFKHISSSETNELEI